MERLDEDRWGPTIKQQVWPTVSEDAWRQGTRVGEGPRSEALAKSELGRSCPTSAKMTKGDVARHGGRRPDETRDQLAGVGRQAICTNKGDETHQHVGKALIADVSGC